MVEERSKSEADADVPMPLLRKADISNSRSEHTTRLDSNVDEERFRMLLEHRAGDDSPLRTFRALTFVCVVTSGVQVCMSNDLSVCVIRRLLASTDVKLYRAVYFIGDKSMFGDDIVNNFCRGREWMISED